jgi:hypothetical protein
MLKHSEFAMNEEKDGCANGTSDRIDAHVHGAAQLFFGDPPWAEFSHLTGAAK